jgi:hypothetical protein
MINKGAKLSILIPAFRFVILLLPRQTVPEAGKFSAQVFFYFSIIGLVCKIKSLVLFG